MTTTIAQIASLPNGSGLTELQGKVTNVYKVRPAGDKTVQDIEISDGGGNTVKGALWGRQDCGFLSGKEVLILAGPKGGLKVKYDDFKKQNTLSISAGCSITPIASGSASSAPKVSGGNVNVTADVEVSVKGAPGSPQPIAGAKVGMAINNAVLLHTNNGAPCDMKSLGQTASDIIRLSNWLEAGNLYPVNATQPKKEAPKPVDEQVPF